MLRLGAIGLLLGLMLAACSSIEADWQTAASANTIGAYQDFLKEHPNGQHADEARARIKSLEDDQAWMMATATNTQQSFEQYLRDRPSGSHAQEARDRITGFERAAAWKTAQSAGSPAAIQSFLQRYPTGPESDEARAALQRLQNVFQVQLAAYRSRKEADRVSAHLRRRFGRVLHDIIVVPPTPPDRLNHVRSAPMSEEQANAVCATLKKSHQRCEVIKSG